MKSYLSLREAAEKWGVSERRINQYCAQGRIPGAERVGKAWAIPADAQKPVDPRRTWQQGRNAPAKPVSSGLLDQTNLMPLMNTAFASGKCRETVEAISPGPRRDIAAAEYYYFSGHPEEAAREAEAYLTSPDMGARLSACLIYAYANLSLKHIQRAEFVLGELNASLASAGEQVPQFQAAAAFVTFAGTVLLHLPLPEKMPDAESFLPLLPPGLRAFALYVQAHYLYVKKEYAHSAGIVEATLAMGAAAYPISAIYLHLVAVMDYMSMKQTDRAKAHLLTAWEIARPDDLTTTEFVIAMLAARDWTTQEIAEHLKISANTVKTHIFVAMRKLNVKNRKDLKQYMLL
ncbi:MAG TPA: LuxR C-terminal-related transcriptional regulator [Candidatus Blautia faecavium]|uniref:LuxR C-terminal-related transcriptional regulator n=1 Tax=Candidatus Blautia faecavium TaxID=2838487 RepID=A0A9D2LU29_9FIRM|nr:LuxR C-terminal-related transcriptional regulator [Candidatus Blautia faecavium]